MAGKSRPAYEAMRTNGYLGADGVTGQTWMISGHRVVVLATLRAHLQDEF
ncbi:hypothetical protein EV192_105396 [Actinocrispum wychmicini]|uniref:Uncharacterized protein n=2 Tax=Actinocrispum wychmicini TaxID=1213861 RepID=A0A4R2JF32_9PSEU|nr:hypothetical protein EV192_105396 [Actinocrispum wychmicini]